MLQTFKVVIFLFLAISIHQVNSAKLRTGSPLHSQTQKSSQLRDKLHPLKNEKIESLKPLLHPQKDVKLQVELGSTNTNTNPTPNPTPLAADIDITGVADFNYVHDDLGDALFDFSYHVNSLSGKGENDTSGLFYSLSKANGLISLNISQSNITNESNDIDGCEGWWLSENVDLTNGTADSSKWFLNNCFIYDTSNGKVLALSTINFNTVSGPLLQGFTWVCNSRGVYWLFDFATCAWENTQNLAPLSTQAAVINFLQVD